MNAADGVTLREYVETVFREYRDAHRREHELTAESVQRAREVVDARLEAMNELRAQILTERGEFLRQTDIEPLAQRVRLLEKQNDTLNGRVAALVAGLAVGLAVFQVLLRYLMP